MKKIQWLTVATISIIVSTINIIHVVIGSAKTPTGFTYLATGHYYLDYFEYLQHIATGISGRWLPINNFTTDPTLVDWRFFPYILLGKIAWFFHLSPIITYWVSIFFLTLLTLIGFYYLINLMLQKETFTLKIIAFLIAIFSGPAYKIFVNNGQLILNPYDFWYGPAAFIRRLEAIPYHALGLLLLLIIVFFVNNIWRNIHILSNKSILINSIMVSILSAALLTFSPLSLASLVPALLIISTIYYIKLKSDRLKIFLLNGILLMVLIPIGLILRHNIGYGGISFEMNWISRDPWWFVLFNLGPIILFFPFGIKEYLKENNFLKQLLLVFTLVSYCLFISPAAYYLGIHNLRFFSSISYIFYGVLTVLGIKKISSMFKNKGKIIILLISSVLIFYSSFLTFYTLYKRAAGLDPTTPETIWTYLPSPIIEGLKLLQNYPQRNVLVGPYGGIGMFVPTFSYKKVYVSHPAGTPDFEKKQSTAYHFYSGMMTKEEANKFIKRNKIGFVILTSYDNFDAKIISHYSFLKSIFLKPSITIWTVNK
ncbi:MAG: hypothetical protein ACD_12C00272G0006 [uncultured bacterium]|nr:MAG: hypothetical protein ACD_12C00272G0006 [uncultured bacterium]